MHVRMCVCVCVCVCGMQSFAYYQGQHQDMLDAMMYYVAFMVTSATAVTMAAELIDPEAFWLGCVKSYTVWLQVRLHISPFCIHAYNPLCEVIQSMAAGKGLHRCTHVLAHVHWDVSSHP